LGLDGDLVGGFGRELMGEEVQEKGEARRRSSEVLKKFERRKLKKHERSLTKIWSLSDISASNNIPKPSGTFKLPSLNSRQV
jgi:hypothetical protein